MAMTGKNQKRREKRPEFPENISSSPEKTSYSLPSLFLPYVCKLLSSNRQRSWFVTLSLTSILGLEEVAFTAHLVLGLVISSTILREEKGPTVWWNGSAVEHLPA
jgi:hypothetical protein